MRAPLLGACLCLLAISAVQGIRSVGAFNDSRDFARAETIAKTMRYGQARRTRLDNWFEDRHPSFILTWKQTSRPWGQATVPILLQARGKEGVLEYRFNVDLAMRMLTAADALTADLERDVRAWAARSRRSDDRR